MSKIAVVTGAGAGIGRAISLRLARDGADVVVTDINLEATKEVANEIQALKRKALPMKLDVMNNSEVKKAFEDIIQKFGAINILVNNAGGSARERKSLFHESDEEIWDYVINLNLKSVLNCCRAAIGPMIKQRSGKIVNIASVSGILGHKKLADYSAAKAGVIGFTMALAKEVVSYGINVNCVSPGPIETPGVLKGHSQADRDEIKEATGYERFGKPEDIASMVAFLTGDESGFITGQNFPVCGLRNLGY